MAVYTDTISLSTKGGSDVLDVTPALQECIRKSGISDGIAHIFCPGSTGGLSATEFEPGAVRDLKECLDLYIPPTPPGPPLHGAQSESSKSALW